MVSSFVFLQQIRDRLLRQKQLNLIGFFIPLAISSWLFAFLVLSLLSFSYIWSFLPPLICCGFLWIALQQARTMARLETTAVLIDDKIGGKDRFLTLVSTSQKTNEKTLYTVVQQQSERLAKSFQPEKDLPFSLDRRILFSAGGTLLSLLLFLLLPRLERSLLSFSTLSQDKLTAAAQDEAIEILEETAQRLLQRTSTQQEQMIGAHLSALAQQLKDPSLSLQEKQQLSEAFQKRFNLELSFPQLLPFDLQIFASKNKDGQGEGVDKGPPQAGHTKSTNTDPKEGQSQGATSATTSGNELSQNTEQDGDKNNQPQPRQEGGGITFNFPQGQKKNQERSLQDASGADQQPSQEQAKDDFSPGTDPARLGGKQNEQAQNQKNQKGNAKGTGEEQTQQSKGGVAIGQGRGERFLKPGEQPGSGFLTEDARFVKVRIPIGQDSQTDEGARTVNNDRATPKTPYSNAPLRESAPEQAQVKQPIPLEYRKIFKD